MIADTRRYYVWENNRFQMPSTPENEAETGNSDNLKSYLWLPYFAIAIIFICFLAMNFWCYHKKHKLKYQRKAEVTEARERFQKRRFILKMLKSKYSTSGGELRQEIVPNYV